MKSTSPRFAIFYQNIISIPSGAIKSLPANFLLK